MDSTSIAFSLIAIAAAVIVPVLIYKKENPKRQLSYHVSSARLLSPRAGQESPINVAYAGTPVPNPHLVTVTLRSTGSADIASADFDSRKPLSLNLNTPIYGVASDSIRTATDGSWNVAETILSLEPTLLNRHLYLQETYLTAGIAEPEMEHHLINTDVISDNAQIERLEERERSWVIAMRATVLPMLIAVLVLILGAISDNESLIIMAGAIFVTTLAIMFTLGLIAGRLHSRARALNLDDYRKDAWEWI